MVIACINVLISNCNEFGFGYWHKFSADWNMQWHKNKINGPHHIMAHHGTQLHNVTLIKIISK